MVGPSIGVGHSGADRCPTVLVVGASSRDLDPTDPRGWRLGGGVTYGSTAAARLGVRVRVLIGVDREASSAHELDALARAGVDVEPVLLTRGPVFDNVERPEGRLQICHQVSDRLLVGDLPRTWHDADAVVLAPVAGELGASWASVLPRRAVVGLGWQGLLRRLSAGHVVESVPARPSALLRRADIVVASVEDLRAGGPRLDRLIGLSGQQLLITNRASPALYLRCRTNAYSVRAVPAVPVARQGDPTGAGDALLATWVSALAVLHTRGVEVESWRLLAIAMAAAAAKVEAETLADMADLPSLARKVLRRPRSASGG
jgi:sugar/nucleoside kinase (ribokinase family)